MEIDPLSLIAAASAFLSIWFGHVAVRKIESISRTIWMPTAIFAGLGMLVEIISLFTAYRPLSTALGILGITLLWDGLEFSRQQIRVKKGHAPANPNNPRHARFLADPRLHATPLDLLNREPVKTWTTTPTNLSKPVHK